MKKLLILVMLLLAGVTFFFVQSKQNTTQIITGAPPYDPTGGNVSEDADFSWIDEWKRPEGPPKVALQVGHWKNDEVPDELHRLRGNTGATGGGKTEWEVNYKIAEETKKLLEEQGITVELLPATVPPQYWADIFVSIHADGSLDTSKSGFKLASPRRDRTGKAEALLSAIEKTYEESTNLEIDPNVTRNMRGYYAFSWWRYEHAVHPMTTSVILETGFLTSSHDRTIIVNQPDLAAQGLYEGIIEFLVNEELLKV